MKNVLIVKLQSVQCMIIFSELANIGTSTRRVTLNCKRGVRNLCILQRGVTRSNIWLIKVNKTSNPQKTRTPNILDLWHLSTVQVLQEMSKRTTWTGTKEIKIIGFQVARNKQFNCKLLVELSAYYESHWGRRY